MSLLRACAFSKCLNRRSLFEKCAARVSSADCCQLCVSVRNGAVRRISETPSQLQRRSVSFVIPKTEDAQKRVRKQTQLLNVLEARIQQLQSDVILDVQHAEVEFLKAPLYGRSGSSSSGWVPSTPKEKTDIPKGGQTVAKGASTSQPSRWVEKLSQEKKHKLKKLQHLQHKIQPKGKGKSTEKSKGSRSSLMHCGTTYETITLGVKDKVENKEKGPTQLGHQSFAAASSRASATAVAAAAAAGEAAKSHKISKQKQKISKKQVLNAEKIEQSRAELEVLERQLGEQVSQSTSSTLPAHLHNDSGGHPSGGFQHSIHSYLEACVFVQDTEWANRLLLGLHRISSRRKHLNTDVYNIIMRMWAKKGALNHIGRMFILLEEAGLKPNLGSYCAALECMGRNSQSSKVISRCLSQMEEDGLHLDDLFSQCVFRQDERDMLLKAIRTVKPDYQPNLNLQTNQCSSSLVHDFYTQRADHTYPKLDFTQEELQERFKRQLSVEQACTVTIDSVEAAKPITENMAKMRKLLEEQRTHWRKILLHALLETKTILANSKTENYKLNLYPYLCLLKDSEYVDIMIQCVSSMPPSGESLITLGSAIGNKVYTIYSVRQKQQNQMMEKLGNIYNKYTAVLAKDTKAYKVLPREQWCELETEHSSGPTLQVSQTRWPYKTTLELGTFMVDLMVKNLKISSDILNPAGNKKLIPVLYHMYTFRHTGQIGFIKPHPILAQLLLEAVETKLTFESFVMPMVCPPVPWSSAKFGAYLLTPTKLIRAADGATQHERLLENCQNLQPILDSLNQLGNCAWMINKPLLDIIITIFNDRGSDKLDIPPPLSEAPKASHFNPKDPTYTASEKAHMKREAINAKKKCSEMHSLRMSALYKLSIAHHMRDEIFWFPHTMDFRGRTYPCPPHFNHLGSDVTRAILLFAEGRPLGPKGLDWLKIHLVNLTGLKKRCSLQERLEYANTIMEDILDSADNPLNGKKWWMNADEPWQALGCCMEIAKAVRSPNPTQFISHFPVHQDGSCNGLQHYAALGRDVIGATSVNLMPCDLPQDVYSAVAQQVEELRARDAQQGLKIAQVLEGFIGRKVVKQTVMTVVYGVTSYGGRRQIEKRLSEIEEFPQEHVWDASHYLVNQVFSSLKEMFTGTREIQDWLTESARLISKSGHSVEWVTPLGLPIIQPYHRSRRDTLQSASQNLTIRIKHDTKERPNTVKQKNAFPPNFIHSLDSTHMMLTALHCYRAGLTFVSVHDCFWTHAITVDTMNKVCREQFVALHSQPILQELSNFLLLKYCAGPTSEVKNKKYQEYKRLKLLLAKVPQTGDFDLQQVKESTFFFS